MVLLRDSYEYDMTKRPERDKRDQSRIAALPGNGGCDGKTHQKLS